MNTKQTDPVYEYLACWIESEDDCQALVSQLTELGISSDSLTIEKHGRGNGASIRYLFNSSESLMLDWRNALRLHDLDPFYVHQVRQLN